MQEIEEAINMYIFMGTKSLFEIKKLKTKENKEKFIEGCKDHLRFLGELYNIKFDSKKNKEAKVEFTYGNLIKIFSKLVVFAGVDEGMRLFYVYENEQLEKVTAYPYQYIDNCQLIEKSYKSSNSYLMKLMYKEKFTDDKGNMLLIISDKQYFYYDGYWKTLTKQEIEHKVIDFLEEKDVNITSSKIKDLIISIKKFSYYDGPDRVKLFNKKVIEEIDETFVTTRKHLINPITGEVKELDASYFIKNQIEIEYDASATCPMWDKFIKESFAGREKQAIMLQEAAGYTLSESLKYNKFMLLAGESGTGKSTFTETFAAVLGKSNCSNISLARDNKNYSEYKLAYSKANFVGELPTDYNSISEEKLKSITSGDAFETKKIYDGGISIVATAKLFFNTNKIPKFNDKSDAIWNRLILLNFENIPEKKDYKLREKLLSELPGILNWAIAGLKSLLIRDEFDIDLDAINAARKEQCTVEDFFENKCELIEDEKTEAFSLYDSYNAYTKSGGSFPLSRNSFYLTIKKKFGLCKKRGRIDGKLGYAFFGVKLYNY